MSNISQSPAKQSTMPQWLIFAGIIAAAIGGIIMGVANKRKEHEQNVDDFTRVLVGQDRESWGESPAVQAAVTLGYFGLGLLIVGGLVALVGLAVMAARR